MQTINESYYDILLERAKLHPERLAIVKNSDRLTYKNLIDRIDRIASYLISLGVKKGDKVVIWSTAHPMWLCAYYGIIRAGIEDISKCEYEIYNDGKGLKIHLPPTVILGNEIENQEVFDESHSIFVPISLEEVFNEIDKSREDSFLQLLNIWYMWFTFEVFKLETSRFCMLSNLENI